MIRHERKGGRTVPAPTTCAITMSPLRSGAGAFFMPPNDTVAALLEEWCSCEGDDYDHDCPVHGVQPDEDVAARIAAAQAQEEP